MTHALTDRAPRRRRHVLTVLLAVAAVAVGTQLLLGADPGGGGAAVAARAPLAADTPSSAEPQAARTAPAAYGIWRKAKPRASDRRTTATTVGTRFRPTRSGRVTALRFYSVRAPQAAVRMRLFTAGGRRLGQVRIPRSGAAGWQARALARPVALHTGRTYVVSYTVPGRHVSRRGNVFAKGRVVRSGALVATGARVATHGQSFPTRSSTSAFFADVAFVPDVLPTESTAGVPAGWRPKRTVNGTYTVRTPGAVVEDLRVNGGLEVAADNVTLRRVEVVGGWIGNWPGRTCTTGLLMQQVSVVRAPGQKTAGLGAAISTGGYTADRVKIDGFPEGFRVGGKPQGCGPVVVRDSYARITPPNNCESVDWHGDSLQGWQGNALTVRNSVLILEGTRTCTGTSPFFYPDQGNTSVDIDGLLVEGGGYSFRLGTRGSVRNLEVVAGSYWFGPFTADCSLLSTWDARLVRLVDGRRVTVRKLPCG
ncbi:DUF4082 domain-containing protein [Nocardioides sp. CER19]|uniref:DUF4082 domain-containing protein n=1 Tax=Nocardioides sp. CER19 TaxID=3038538 RepID=UPI002449C7B6|nr:DUF4082 domain-containing protein [Nocardioides sp. CER19]MDH2414836.1 DUF4082 domain-containing protein [Nocardioides sp. CER19]